MLEHGTWACRSAGCCCADCRAVDSLAALEERRACLRERGIVRPSRAKLMESAAQDACVVHVPGNGDALYRLPGRGMPRILEVIG